MSATREQIYQALLAVAWNAYGWKNDLTGARRLKLWASVPPEQRPALFQFEGGDEHYTWSNNANPKRQLPASLIMYFASSDEAPGAPQINAVMDALDVAFGQTGQDGMLGRFTLGGKVYNCRIEGSIFKDPGDLDGDGMLKVPISIILP